MKQFARRALTRAGQLVLHPLERRQEALRQQLVKRLDRLDERVERAITQAEQNAALLSSRGTRVHTAPRGRALPRLASELAEPFHPPVSSSLSHEISALIACPCCGHDVFSLVSEYNRFLTSGEAPDRCASRYDYSLCDRCGVVFARLRPTGERFRTLLHRFEDTLGRARKQGGGVDVFGSRRLTPEEAERIRTSAARGVFGSAGGEREAIPALLRDRLAVSAHIEILSSLLLLQSPRVLELRPRFGAIGGALRRLFGGETCALPLFEAQQIVVRDVYGTRADALLDYDQFDIPYEGSFDLVVANHMVTHAVRPAAMLSTIRERLRPGGHLYLYNEPDEADFLDSGKSMFKTLNPFHLQTFDPPSLSRVLQAAGFHTVFSTHYQGNCVVLAKRAEPSMPAPPGPKARKRRLARYAAARDRSILMLPDGLRGHLRDEWEAVVARGFESGLVALDARGRLCLSTRRGRL
jgi:SAM-dependent methyltransferase